VYSAGADHDVLPLHGGTPGGVEAVAVPYTNICTVTGDGAEATGGEFVSTFWVEGIDDKQSSKNVIKVRDLPCFEHDTTP
jgi:hypothetical protein